MKINFILRRGCKFQIVRCDFARVQIATDSSCELINITDNWIFTSYLLQCFWKKFSQLSKTLFQRVLTGKGTNSESSRSFLNFQIRSSWHRSWLWCCIFNPKRFLAPLKSNNMNGIKFMLFVETLYAGSRFDIWAVFFQIFCFIQLQQNKTKKDIFHKKFIVF